MMMKEPVAGPLCGGLDLAKDVRGIKKGELPRLKCFIREFKLYNMELMKHLRKKKPRIVRRGGLNVFTTE